MGLATAPGLMQLVMRHVTRLVMDRLPSVRAQVYLDDFLFLSRNPEDLLQIPDLFRTWGLRINVAKSIVNPTRQLRYLGVEVDLNSRTLSVTPRLQRQVLGAIQTAPLRSLLYRQRLAGFVNFLRPIAKLPLQVVSEILHGNPDLTDWVRDRLFSHPWVFSAQDYHLHFRVHRPWVASDATPTCLGITAPGAALSIPIPELPIYEAELLGLWCASLLAPPGTTIYGDNRAALINMKKGRCPPSWVPFCSRLCASRSHSYRYVPSEYNPADLPSRTLCLTRAAQ